MSLNLVAGEKLLHRSKCNAVVIPSQYGLSQFAAGQLMGLVGMSDREAIGGHLHVTSLRLAFRAHALNRLRGTLSIPLPIIDSALAWRSGLAVGVEVLTEAASFQFVSWSRGAVLAALEDARRGFGSQEAERISQAGKAASDMGVREGAEATNVAVDALVEVSGATPSWIDALSLVQFQAVATLPPGGGKWLRQSSS